LLVGGVVKQKHKKEISELVALTRKLVEKESIYRGRATLIDFDYDPDDFDPSRCPTFMRLGGVRKEELIFPEKVQKEIDTSLFAPVQHSKLLREMQVPLKRGVLMFGDFGVGKTLCANIAAKMCEENDWTFVYLRDANQLPAAIDFAHQYQPCMIFSEDIDQVLSGKGKRAKKMNDILNVIDGIDSKGSEIMVVLTTNHIEEIHQAALRPGRLDAVIHIEAPDEKAVEKLIRNYSRGRLADNEDLSEIGKVLKGQIPALIREVVEKSKISAAMRCVSGSSNEVRAKDVQIVASDLLVAAESLTDQIELLKPKGIDKRIELEKLGDALGSRIGDSLEKALNGNSKN
jgi:transitional endoplasmic reticulum ATPase